MHSDIPTWLAAVIRVAEIAIVFWLVWLGARWIFRRARGPFTW